MARRGVEMATRDIALATAGLEPDAIARELADLARRSLADVIASGEASPIYDRWVNGRKDADESAVVPPGPIVYVFSYWEPIIAFALDFLRRRSPVKTGRYQSSHIVMVGGQAMRPDAQIGGDEDVTIVDTQPYARKIEVGHMRMSVPDGVYQDARRAVSAKFRGMVRVEFRMIHLPGGYILKGVFRRGHKPKARTRIQRDTRAGERVTYPAIIMSMRGS